MLSTKLKIFYLVLIVITISLGIFILAGIKGEDKGIVESSATNINKSSDSNPQVIEVKVKGGYLPKSIQARANVSTTLKMITNNTYDCSLGFTIPKIGYRKVLPSTGTTTIEIPAQTAGTTITGICTMGMYRFNIEYL